jgi:lysophospholipase L1-like esterase
VTDQIWRRFVALGDSLTEGMCDPAAPGADHPWRGWADRVATGLAAEAAAHDRPFDYANLAVRGRLLAQIVAEQVPAALEMRPDLVSLIGGGNDVIRPGVVVDEITDQLEQAVVRLVGSGATVLLATSYDPRQAALMRRTRGTAGIFAANVWSIARRHGCLVLDLWGMRALQDRRMWAADRIHLTDEGHRRVADQVLELLGLDPAEPPGPLDPLPPRSRQEAWREDAVWVRGHLLPWVGRRVRGRSSGDGLTSKRPVPAPITPADHPADHPARDRAGLTDHGGA